MIEENGITNFKNLSVLTEEISIPITSEELDNKIKQYEEEKLSEIRGSLTNVISILKELCTQYNAQDKPYDDIERQLTIDISNLIKIYNKISDEDFND